MPRLSARPALLPLLIAVLLPLFSMAGSGCGADETIKQGIAGEPCNGSDLDCREGLVCFDGACRDPGVGPEVSCQTMCARLQSCGAPQAGCLGSCEATIGGNCAEVPCPWGASAVDAFGTCLIEGLSCEEARREDAPSVCYNRIPLDAEREERCQNFIAAVNDCGAGSTETLRERCYLLGRTTSEESWTRTDACVARVAAGVCANIGACLNDVFELSPPLSLSDVQPPVPVDVVPEE